MGIGASHADRDHEEAAVSLRRRTAERLAEKIDAAITTASPYPELARDVLALSMALKDLSSCGVDRKLLRPLTETLQRC